MSTQFVKNSSCKVGKKGEGWIGAGVHTQHNKAWLKGKWSNPGKGVVPSLHLDVLVIETGASRSLLTIVSQLINIHIYIFYAQTTIYIYIYIWLFKHTVFHNALSKTPYLHKQ